MGPRLGPLVVTGVPARALGPDAARLVAGPVRGALSARLGDSKRLVGFGRSSLGEAWARALLEAAGRRADSPAQLLSVLCLDEPAAARGLCPADPVLCWGEDQERFQSAPETLLAVAGDVESLRRRGVELEVPAVVVTCVDRLNESRQAGLSRQDVDLASMERVFLCLRGRAGQGLQAVCGKVGSRRAYRDRLPRLTPDRLTTLAEGPERSVYRVDGDSTLSFVRDAEDAHLLVALASLVGKWVRDLLMARVVRHLRSHAPGLPEASGYQDPVTERLIRESEPTRRALGIHDRCFERR